MSTLHLPVKSAVDVQQPAVDEKLHAHRGKVFDYGGAAPGATIVYYAHGSESLRTYLGKSKFHVTPNCRALLGRDPSKSLIMEWLSDVPETSWCRTCRPRVLPT